MCLLLSKDDKVKIILEEYKSLRVEGLKCYQGIVNCVWISLSAYIFTILAATASVGTILAKGDGHAKQSILIIFEVAMSLILIQGAAAKVMYFKNLWKYKRLGEYIKNKIEIKFYDEDAKTLREQYPLYWEHWVSDKRLRFFYYVDIALLLMPSIIFLFYFFYSNDIKSLVTTIAHCNNLPQDNLFFSINKLLAYYNILFAFIATLLIRLKKYN